MNAGYLTTEQVQKLAPAILTAHPSPTVSASYKYVNTVDVLRALEDMGYHVVKAQQGVAKNGGRQYAKHIVRVMHRDYLESTMRQVGDVVPQIILTNSHNRTSAFHMSCGLYRLVCSNGLAVESAGFASVRVLHNDPAIYENIVKGVCIIREITTSTVVPKIELMNKLELSDDQVHQFARAASVLKNGTVFGEDDIEHLLATRREEDAGRNMWQVLNRIQENMVKGGYTTVDAAGRNITSRGITSPVRDLDFNVRLWSLGSRITDELTA